METLRRTFGIAEPVRREMELKIVRDGSFRPAVLGGSAGGNLHEDILVLGGRDTEVGWEDIFHGGFYYAHMHMFLFILLTFFFPLQVTNSRNLLPSMMKWRREYGWRCNFSFLFFFC